MNDPQREHRDARIRHLFNTLDTRAQNKICSIDDLRQGLRELGHPLEAADTLLQEVFDHIDSGQDGVITFQEFKDFVLETEDKLRRLFQQIDVLNQGRLKKFEIQRALHKAGVHHTDARMNHFFEAMDLNNDGYITFEEWRDFLLFLPERLPDVKNIFLYYNSIHQVSSEGDILISDENLHHLGFFLAGGIAGAVSRTTTAPFDRLKVALIASTETSLFEAAKQGRLASGLAQTPIARALADIYSQGGIRSFFVGNGLNVIKIFPESAIKFGSYEAAKRFIAGTAGTDELSTGSRFAAGGIAGAISQASVYPIDTLKFRVQCETGSSENGSMIRSTAVKMWNNGGMRSFYRGLPLGIIGIVPYSSIDLGTFEMLKRGYIARKAKLLKIKESDVDVPNYLVLTFGASSGAFGASLVYPLNLLRTRLQAQGTKAHPQTYTGPTDVVRKTIQKEGYRGLWKGLLPNLLKVIPSVSISYLVYEKSKQYMGL
ncbi:putative Calcium dependent mitochondrial carrier protein [Taphrina deformans PYCC 5710]|uniref:Calcium dependent mitochondrial carrier protein n=1 Tax=Taphrina deformans (strain PYCC 5710 / ATCC 11124 / CBS 356.35 / IMI 108563 / JCM 9778 / NBRC 8474) TaxID=1097556 RepID=R4ZY44_TAPDE|nr:putative Calcium dependent mitochondrial carrier protein [Taphrina deformans PYCC 5710]|eukprot:CCX35433.1 putative Calcium dependent mitochondrial carrier protein [Taphrina deformans PYCC 5710]